MSNICKSCGAELQENMKFCAVCGVEQLSDETKTNTDNLKSDNIESTYNVNQMPNIQSGYNVNQMPNMQSGYNVNQMQNMQSGYNVNQMPNMQSGYNVNQMPNMQSGYNVNQMQNMQSGYNVNQMQNMQSGYNVNQMPNMQSGYNVNQMPNMQNGYYINPGQNMYYGNVQPEKHNIDAGKLAKDGLNKIMGEINEKMGETGNVEVHLKDLFSEVFKKHTNDERDLIFACGTKATTPLDKDIVADWPKPWFYSRVFLSLLLVTFVLYLLLYSFGNGNAFPGYMFMGSMVVPFSILIFFWEVNAPRNISFYQVISMFFVGGVMSLLITIILYEIIPVGELSYTGAFLVGLIEEVGKVVIAIYYIKKTDTKYILSGILIGGCIGAGFAVFESAGYAFNIFLDCLYQGASTNMSMGYMTNNILLRAFCAFGTHAVWAAMTGAALVAVKRVNKFDVSMIFSGRFIFFMIYAIGLHALWDCPLEIFGYYGKMLILTILAWIVLLVQISAGLKQISKASKEEQIVNQI